MCEEKRPSACGGSTTKQQTSDHYYNCNYNHHKCYCTYHNDCCPRQWHKQQLKEQQHYSKYNLYLCTFNSQPSEPNWSRACAFSFTSSPENFHKWWWWWWHSQHCGDWLPGTDQTAEGEEMFGVIHGVLWKVPSEEDWTQPQRWGAGAGDGLTRAFSGGHQYYTVANE